MSARRVLLLVVGFLLCAMGARAETDWRNMYPESFPLTWESARDQCHRHADDNPRDALTRAHCEELSRLLRERLPWERRCETVDIPDDAPGRPVIYTFMSQPSGLLREARKRLGRSDRATRCRLSGGVVADIYEGCGNLGTMVPRITTTPPNCRMVCTGQTVTTDESLVLPSVVYQTSCGCYRYIPGRSIPGGNTIQSQTCTYVCDE